MEGRAGALLRDTIEIRPLNPGGELKKSRDVANLQRSSAFVISPRILYIGTPKMMRPTKLLTAG